MSTPNLEQIAHNAAREIAAPMLEHGIVSMARLERIILAALRSVAQPEPKPRYHTTASTEMDPHPGFSSSPQPEPKRFPAEQGTGTVPEEVRRALIHALPIGLDRVSWADHDRIMQAIAPFLAGGEDKARLDWLEKQYAGPSVGKAGAWVQIVGSGPMLRLYSGKTARSAIDQARAATTPSTKESP